MKKIMKVVLATFLLVCFAGCNKESDGKNDDENSTDVDMSKYLAEISEWSGQNFVDYFTDAGVFSNDNGYETWIQDHTSYWPDTPVNECAGWWNKEGTDRVMILIMKSDNADTSEEQMNEWIKSIKENHTLPGEYASLPVDHLVGNVAFSFETSILDDANYEAFNNAYQQLLTALNVTPDM